MDSLRVNIERLLASSTSVDEAKISGFSKESQFVSTAVDLFEEIRKITVLIGASFRTDEYGNPRPMTRDEAILGGLLARVIKLQTSFFDQICQRRQETAIILKRCLVETLVNLAFLIKNNSKNFFDGFIKYSFVGSIPRLQQYIENEIQARGHTLPMEERMLESMRRSQRKAGFSDEDITLGYSPWPKTIRERFQEVFDNSSIAYLAFMSGPSNAIHGNWEDIVRYNMKFNDGHWCPKLDWANPRPQLITSASLISAHVTALYADDLIANCHDKQMLLNFLNREYPQKVRSLDSLHEVFVQKVTSSLPNDDWDEQ